VFSLDPVRTVLGIVMLGYASYRDLRTREVHDLLWVVFGALGVALNLYEIATGTLSPIRLVVPVLFAVGFSSLSGYLGLFGGADLLAFVALSLLQPQSPKLGIPLRGFTPLFFPLTVVSNSVLAGASTSVVILFLNLVRVIEGVPLFERLESVPLWKKFFVLISGRKMRLDRVVGPPYQYPLETLESGRRRLVLRPDLYDDVKAVDAFEALRSAGVSYAWVSHTLPFLLFLSIGYIVSIFFGDIALWICSRVLL
jgi:preflagellin peptidase FlaK